jgi:hypothetical protein
MFFRARDIITASLAIAVLSFQCMTTPAASVLSFPNGRAQYKEGFAGETRIFRSMIIPYVFGSPYCYFIVHCCAILQFM